RVIESQNGLLSTIAWGIDDKVYYALEGSVFVSGAAVQWLRDEMGIIKTASETEDIARQVDDTAGAYLVPAFTGLGAPYWDPYARGTIVGITRGVNYKHIVRATIESMAYQTYDLLMAMSADLGHNIVSLKVDGGASQNDFLLEFQADILNAQVYRPRFVETTSLGVAYLAGLASGYWKSTDDILANWHLDRCFEPELDEARREELLHGWHKAVEKSLMWAK
ncbi:MAG: FGGY-family carbohydrate kinase, partial [Bacillota bacterium]|nr:FGGY-family carbohydrate kinase [Bacillota bacterium]